MPLKQPLILDILFLVIFDKLLEYLNQVGISCKILNFSSTSESGIAVMFPWVLVRMKSLQALQKLHLPSKYNSSYSIFILIYCGVLGFWGAICN